MKSANELWFAILLLSTVSCDNREHQDYSNKLHQKHPASITNTYNNLLSGRYGNIISKCLAPSSNLVRIHISGTAVGGDGENPVIFTEDFYPNISDISDVFRGPLFMDQKAMSSADKIDLKLFLLHYPYLLNDPPVELQFYGWRMTLNDLCRMQYMFTDAIMIDQFSKTDGPN